MKAKNSVTMQEIPVVQVEVKESLKGRKHTKAAASRKIAVLENAADDPMTESFRKAVSSSLQAKQQNGSPIARYDSVRRKAYLEYPGGRKQYVE